MTGRKRNSPDDPVRIFVTGGSTESTQQGRAVVREIVDILRSLDAKIIAGPEAALPARLGMLHSADAMLVVRTGPSESAAFEIAYNMFGGPRVPMFFALWKHAVAPAAMRELEQMGPAESATFGRGEELRSNLVAFLEHVAEDRRTRELRMIRMMERLVA